jgi:hypothetical protein
LIAGEDALLVRGFLSGGWFGQEFFYEGGDLVLELLVSLRVGGAGESGVDLADSAVAPEDEGGGPAVEVVGLGDLLVELVGSSGDEDGIGDAVTIDEGAKAGGVLELVVFLEGEVYDLETFGVELLVEGLEEGGLVVAVGAPGAADGDDDDLVAELGIGVRDLLAGEVGEGEGEGSGGVLDAGLLGGFGRSGEVLLAGFSRTAGYEVAGLGLLGFGGDEVGDEESTVGLRGERVERGAGGSEVADGLLVAIPGTVEGAGVAVDALDDGVDEGGLFRGRNAELPGGLALVGGDGDLPVAFDVGAGGESR